MSIYTYILTYIYIYIYAHIYVYIYIRMCRYLRVLVDRSPDQELKKQMPMKPEPTTTTPNASPVKMEPAGDDLWALRPDVEVVDLDPYQLDVEVDAPEPVS